RRGSCRILPGKRTRHVSPSHALEPAQPIRSGRILVAADRPEGALPAALHSERGRTPGVATNSGGVQSQGAGRDWRQGSSGFGAFSPIPLAADTLFRQTL